MPNFSNGFPPLSIESPEIPSCWEVETFEKRSISLKIKAHEDFNRRNILNISRIKIRMQRRDWAKGGIFQRSRGNGRQQMNIVQIPRRFVRSHWGGTETVILETCKRLLKLGHHTEIICPNALAHQDKEVIGGVSISRVPYFYPYLGCLMRPNNS